LLRQALSSKRIYVDAKLAVVRIRLARRDRVWVPAFHPASYRQAKYGQLAPFDLVLLLS
jgi:hypothetical protein